MTGKIKLFGTGGAGVNIASQFVNRSEEPGYATVEPVFIDTSRSNLKDGIDKNNVYILENVDGSGKIRKENAQEIQNVIKDILLKMRPEDFNVVVFSASGGSGSVFGPLLVGEMLNRSIPVVAVVVGSDESSITAQNTMNTLKSMDSIARRSGKPFVMYYDHNQRGVRRSDIDKTLISVITCLSILASRQNEEMDSQDLVNWLEYNKTSSVEPQLAVLDVYETHEKVESIANPISIASLYSSPDVDTIRSVPDYHTVGYTGEGVSAPESLHFIINVDAVPEIGRRIQKTLDELQEIRDSRVSTSALVKDTDNVDGSGLVL